MLEGEGYMDTLSTLLPITLQCPTHGFHGPENNNLESNEIEN